MIKSKPVSKEIKYGSVNMSLGEAEPNHLVTIPVFNKKGERITVNDEPKDIFCRTMSKEEVPSPKEGKIPVEWLGSDPHDAKVYLDKGVTLQLSPETPVTFYCPNDPIGQLMAK